jgi:hypothetical protein
MSGRRAFGGVLGAAATGALVAALLAGGATAAGGSNAVRYKVVGVSGKLTADVTAGYGAFPCANTTSSLFTGSIHGRRPGQSAGQQTQYGTSYNDLFKASVMKSSGRFDPGAGKGEIAAKVAMPYVSTGTGEYVGCGSDYGICQATNKVDVMQMKISLRNIGRARSGVFWDPGGDTFMPRNDIPPLNAVGIAPMYNCRDTYFPWVVSAPRGKGNCVNRAPKPAALQQQTLVLHLKCSYDKSAQFHPYTDGDGTRNVRDKASIEATVKLKRVN